MENKILIVDDDKTDYQIIETHFKRAGLNDTLWAESGEKGVEYAQNIKPDIVLIDTNLPQIDGFETCRRIKAIEGLDAKIIVMTGFIEAVNALKAREVGADDYCAKTSDCDSLIEAVKGLISH